MLASRDSIYNDRYYHRTRGKRQYQLKNHLVNLMATITDRKIPHDVDSDTLVDYYTADIIFEVDY